MRSQVGVVALSPVATPTTRRAWHTVNAFGYSPDLRNHRPERHLPKSRDCRQVCQNFHRKFGLRWSIPRAAPPATAAIPSTRITAATGAPRVPAPTARTSNDRCPNRAHCGTLEKAQSGRGCTQSEWIPQVQCPRGNASLLRPRIVSRTMLNDAQDCQGLTTATPVG